MYIHQHESNCVPEEHTGTEPDDSIAAGFNSAGAAHTIDTPVWPAATRRTTKPLLSLENMIREVQVCGNDKTV